MNDYLENFTRRVFDRRLRLDTFLLGVATGILITLLMFTIIVK